MSQNYKYGEYAKRFVNILSIGNESEKEKAAGLIYSLFEKPASEWNLLINPERNRSGANPLYKEELKKILQSPYDLSEVSALMEFFFGEIE